MVKGAARLAVLTAAALLAGCAVFAIARLEPGKSSEAEVRRALGEPARVYTDPDGTRQLVYPRGPEGRQTYMAFLAPDGRLARLDQVLTEEHFRRIAVGTTNGLQLERLVGPPWRKIPFPNLRQVAWDYVLQDSWGYTVDFSVMVDERDIVANLVSVRRELGRSGSVSR
jgi:hypothetical protein